MIGTAVPCSGKSCTWEIENWGGGWVYAPDYYPTGEVLFQTGAGSNCGQLLGPEGRRADQDTTFGDANLAAYENYLAKQLPVVWQPNRVYALTEVDKNLQGVTPQNTLLNINPEDVVLHEVDEPGPDASSDRLSGSARRPGVPSSSSG